ncbi:uncharacterized protein [Hetaerina americana]|uniref:uncharacterized protein n=1 Tax=Hetaerina americana TaxID=62018 RepID=UPI003A7F48F4
MEKYAVYCVLALTVVAALVTALPAPPAEDSGVSEEVEIIKSEELPLRKKSADTLEDSENIPQPIVDTISEEDKYGNTGDSLGALGRGIVGGSEALSNFVNLAIEYPTNLFKSLAHRATEALNHLGSKLVGL